MATGSLRDKACCFKLAEQSLGGCISSPALLILVKIAQIRHKSTPIMLFLNLDKRDEDMEILEQCFHLSAGAPFCLNAVAG